MKKLTWRDKKIKEIKEWGPLTLFRALKDSFDTKMEQERNIIFKYGADYTNSNLQTHDLYVVAINHAFDREFNKIYEQLEKNMQRQIKFRFWKTETKEWVNFPSRGLSSGEPIIDPVYTDSDYFIIQQFTGSKDINGVDIYEGDIIEILDHNMAVIFGQSKYTKGEIRWLNQAFKICQKGFGAEYFSDYINCDCCNAQIRIIGNIFQTPQEQ